MRGRELDLKVEKEDLTELWLHFDRFSLYEDLKSLHSKVIPEIAKFEQKLINYSYEIEKNKLIIKQFD